MKGEINMNLNPKCENCRNARKACNGDYVGCVAAIRGDYTNDDYCFNFYKRSQISTGWVDLRAKPYGKDSGMITNGIPCFKKDDICEHYEEDVQ